MRSRTGRIARAAIVAALGGLSVLIGARPRGGDHGAVAEVGPGSPLADDFAERARRLRMVAEQIEAQGITDPAVLAAMRAVPRHRFMPEAERPLAYEDCALPIGNGQTISQPFIVALMTALIEPRPTMRVLEVGTGSGYQAAVLASCVGEVETIERIPELGRRAEALLGTLGCRNVHVRIGDGFDGWPERAPFDAIVLTAAPGRRVPRPLLDQLRPGGRIVAPVGRGVQELVVIRKTERGLVTRVVAPVRFVPMTGKAEADR